LVVELTGLEQGHPTVRAIVGTFEALKAFADFSKSEPKTDDEEKGEAKKKKEGSDVQDGGESTENVKLNLAYTINLVLPKTDDVAVFNAIFKSLRENLLKK
jgi:hypothetical protein